MNGSNQKKVVGLLGVGFDHQDGHVRITQGDRYQVLMGSEASHSELQKLCSQIEQAVRESGRELDDYTAEEFVELISTMY